MTLENTELAVIRTKVGRQFVMELLIDILDEDLAFEASRSEMVTAARLERLYLARRIRGKCAATDEGLELMTLAEQERRSAAKRLNDLEEAQEEEGDDE